MKAINESIVNKNRSKLEEVIPLATPYTIAIDPSNLCNFKCTFCAIQSVERHQTYKKQVMNFELYKKIIDDFKEFPSKIKVLRLNGQGEPLLNHDFCEIVKYAKQSDIAEWIETITNGSLLTPKLNEELVNSGIDRIRISIEALSENGYFEIASAKIDFENFKNNIKDLYERSNGKCEIYIKIVDAAVPTQREKELFFEMFGNICHRIFIDNVIPLWSDFKELNERFDINKFNGVHGQDIKEVMVCPFPFYSLIINPDGQVTACCADWQRKLVLGDLNRNSFYEIWTGHELYLFQKDLLLKNKNKYEMCSKCLLPTYDCNDNIDEYAEKIFHNLENMRLQ